MKNSHVFKEIDLSLVKPAGWVKNWLEIQAKGLTGNIEVAGYPFNTKGWNTREFIKGGTDDWWPFEQTGYWVDGALKCGYLINDKKLIKRTKDQIEYVINHADTDGYLGPHFMKEGGGNHRWPHAVFFRSFFTFLDYSKNTKILDALSKHYKSQTSPHTHHREICNFEIMLKLYEKTHDKKILKIAFDDYQNWLKANPKNDATIKNLTSSKRPSDHGVSFNELTKLAALAYLYSGEKKYLNAAKNGYKKLFKDMMLINGVCRSTEDVAKVVDELDSCEVCDIVDMSWALGYMLMATGDSIYADYIEMATFNGFFGAVKSDNFGGLQYFSSPNQTVATNNSNHNFYHKGEQWLSYRPNPGTECCPGNVNRALPNFVSRQWMLTTTSSSFVTFPLAGKGRVRGQSLGIAAVLISPGTVTFKNVQITCQTNYPFEETMQYKFKTKKPTKFPFTIRIPSYCKSASIFFNGKEIMKNLKPGFITISNITFKDGDILELNLPMKIEVKKHIGAGLYVQRGPLVYALKIEENWKVDKKEKRQTKKFPAWNLTAKTPWNYALDTSSFEVVKTPIKNNPWTINSSPIKIKAFGYKVKDWKLDHEKNILSLTAHWGKKEISKKKGNFVFTPKIPKNIKGKLGSKKEAITLVPMGCTHLRVSVFPYKQHI